jgi:hypothetical protein
MNDSIKIIGYSIDACLTFTPFFIHIGLVGTDEWVLQATLN